MMLKLVRGCASAIVFAALVCGSSSASADGRDWTDGPVVNTAYIRTVDGHFDDYMHWLSTTYKKQEEAAKAAGIILGWRIFVVEARTPQDPDIILVTEFKNWAALDHLGSKLDGVSEKIEGSLDASNKGQADRSKIRTILGARTMQEALLK